MERHLIIQDVTPCVDNGLHPVKRLAGEPLDVEATVFRDGHDRIRVLVRWKAAEALGEIRDPRAIDPLLRALRDGSPEVRAQAAISLGELGAVAAKEALAAAMENDPSPAVREVAANALVRVSRVREDRAASRREDRPPGQAGH